MQQIKIYYIHRLYTFRKFSETKRTVSDSMVNAYNTDILLQWRAIMDIRIIGGPYSIKSQK